MGLDKAKSLLPVKEGLSFLDFTAKQLLHLRQTHNTDVPFVVMNSFATSEDTKCALGEEHFGLIVVAFSALVPQFPMTVINA